MTSNITPETLETVADWYAERRGASDAIVVELREVAEALRERDKRELRVDFLARLEWAALREFEQDRGSNLQHWTELPVEIKDRQRAGIRAVLANLGEDQK